MLRNYRGPLKKWLAMGLALACLAPVFLWEALRPAAIDLTAYADSVDYEFRDADYAHEFAALDNAEVK